MGAVGACPRFGGCARRTRQTTWLEQRREEIARCKQNTQSSVRSHAWAVSPRETKTEWKQMFKDGECAQQGLARENLHACAQACPRMGTKGMHPEQDRLRPFNRQGLGAGIDREMLCKASCFRVRREDGHCSSHHSSCAPIEKAFLAGV
jgi:hypothetical protein